MENNQQKRILRPFLILMMAALLFTSIGGNFVVSAVKVHSHDDLEFEAWTSTNSLPSTAGNYYLASDVTISSTWNVPSGTVNLCLDGHGIKMTGTGSVIYIAGGAALNLYDCDETTEHKFTVSDSAANGAGLAVVNDAATGEGVKTFTGGYITGGNANPYGGGVRVEKTGKFNLYGGTIIGNKASSHGGGVSASGADQGVSNTKNFVMSGGAICYNTAPWGGGIAVYGEVYISGNSLISKNVSTAGGAGIELESNGRLYLEGGSITENLLSGQNGGMWKGAGVHVPGGSELHIKGAVQVTNNYQSDGTAQNNVFVRSGLKVTVDDTLAEDARIGIAMQNTTGTFTSGLSGKGTVESFISDNSAYGVLFKDGEAEVSTIAASVTIGNTTKCYDNLSNAIGAWVEGSTLKLFQNTGMQITVGSGARTLDLNGHNISRSGTAIVATNADLTLIDSSGTPGTISNTSSSTGGAIECTGGSLQIRNINVTSKFNGVNLMGGCTATVYSGQIAVTNNWKTVFNVMENSSLTILNGTFRSANHMAVYMNEGTTTIEGGCFKGSFSATVKIKGGYFDRDVSALCAEGYSCAASDDTSKGAYMIKEPHLHDDIFFKEWTSTNSLPTTAGNYYLASDVTISSTWEAPNGVNLCLCGHGIKKTGTGSVIKVGEGRTLKIYDCDTTTEHRYSIASPATNGAGVATVNDALTSGYQTFKGGYITGGYLTGGYQYGAGINLEGNGATLYMYGGTIIGNRLTAGSTGGGGVCVQDWDKSGGFYMYGGSIIGNTSNYGGGVYVRSGKMELIGGNISKNVANGNIGGGVLVFGGNSTLIVEGGSISDNKAVHGGAVEASGDGTVIISGGSFTNNIATGKGGALTNQRTDGDTSPASFSISGSPVFSGNTAGGQANDIYLCNTAVLNLTATLTNTTKIGIKKASTTGTFTSGWSTYMTDGEGKVADPADYFVSENGNYVVKLVDGEAKVAPPHDHDWRYTVDGNVIKATCVGTTGTCDLILPQTLTITAQGKTYDGTSVTASVTKSANWDAYGLATPGSIVYSGNTNAGTYTASVTAGEKTASISFTIAKAPLTVTATAQSKIYGEDDPALTYTANGLIGTDSLSGALTRAVGENVGTYAITQGTLTAGNNYTITYTGANLTITPATMTGILVSGYTGDFDGEAHGISVTAPDGATVKYGTVEGDYPLEEKPTYTNAEIYTVYYEISKANYFSVYGSAVVTINQINATVTITGRNDTVDYDGTEHTVTGYDAVADTELYDVTSDFTFDGDAAVSLTNAGTSYMGLTAEQFANINPNFATVTFVITDGYQSVKKINAEVVKAPEAQELIFNESMQELILAGEASGGRLYYALGDSDGSKPDIQAYQMTIPLAKEVGIYYVWYKVVADFNHIGLDPVCLNVSIAEYNWGSLYGTLYQADGETPLAGATVTLVRGNQTVSSTTTQSNGGYQFIVPPGAYNIVAEYEGKALTQLVTFEEDTAMDLVLPSGKTESYVRVNTEDENLFGVVVGGLDEEARLVRDGEDVPEDQTVSVVMTVEPKAEESAMNVEPIKDAAKNKSLDFFEITVEKTVASVSTVLDETATVLEIVIPYANAGKKGITVYSHHGAEVRTFAESDTKANGTFRVDAELGLVYIYSNSFSTYAIGYTPYYRVDTVISLGSYDGTATVILEDLDDGTTFQFEKVAMGESSFEGIPKGKYQMTLIWEDGVENRMQIPLAIEAKEMVPAEIDEPTPDSTAFEPAPDSEEVSLLADEWQFAGANLFCFVVESDDPKARLPKELQL